MDLYLDHIVHYVKDPEFVRKSFSERGFTTVKGGRHINWGTYNSLCYFSNECYLEWIGIDNIEVARKSDNLLIQQVFDDSKVGEGFTQLALRTNNIEGLANRLKENGHEVIGPVPGSRRREDGSFLDWSMLFISQGHEECRLPFFIQWGEEEELRREQFKPLTEHKVGNAQISAIYFAVTNSKSSADMWLSIFGSTKKEPFEEKKWNAQGYRVQVGGIEVFFCEPAGNGLVKQELIRRGERPFMCKIIDASFNGVYEYFGGRYCFNSIKN